MKPYRTLIKRGSGEFIVNKSRFIGHGAPCESEEEALGFIAEIRARYREASHNCYAYIIGRNMGIMRYSDDGEPGGTAGTPIMEVLRARELVNLCVVVTRYFGGVLLGAGGLVRAYSAGAVTALEAAGEGDMHPSCRCLMDVPYAALDKMEHYLRTASPAAVESRDFLESVMMTLIIKRSDMDEVADAIAALSDGKLELLPVDDIYLPWPEK